MTIPHKVYFRIERGPWWAPPAAVETVRARKTNDGVYVVVDLPFFARAATLGDTIQVQVERGALWYRATVEASANSLLHVFTLERAIAVRVRRSLERLRCSVDLDKTGQFLAVNVPPKASLRGVRACLQLQADLRRLNYEEVLSRQA
jgi:Domain of unknown function (DUF4265)